MALHTLSMCALVAGVRILSSKSGVKNTASSVNLESENQAKTSTVAHWGRARPPRYLRGNANQVSLPLRRRHFELAGGDFFGHLRKSIKGVLVLPPKICLPLPFEKRVDFIWLEFYIGILK